MDSMETLAHVDWYTRCCQPSYADHGGEACNYLAAWPKQRRVKLCTVSAPGIHYENVIPEEAWRSAPLGLRSTPVQQFVSQTP